MKKAVLPCIGAVIIGIAPPFISGAFPKGPLQGMLYALPIAVDQWLWPEGEMQILALAMLAFVVQYLALLAIVAATPPLIRLTLDFLASLAAPSHRRGLMGTRR